MRTEVFQFLLFLRAQSQAKNVGIHICQCYVSDTIAVSCCNSATITVQDMDMIPASIINNSRNMHTLTHMHTHDFLKGENGI